VATNRPLSRALLRHDRRGRCFTNVRTATTKQVLTSTGAKVLPDEDLKPGIPVHLHLRTIGTSMRPVKLIYAHTPCRYSQRLHCAGGVVTTIFLSSRCQCVFECGTKLTRPVRAHSYALAISSSGSGKAVPRVQEVVPLLVWEPTLTCRYVTWQPCTTTARSQYDPVIDSTRLLVGHELRHGVLSTSLALVAWVLATDQQHRSVSQGSATLSRQ
jgi:hypothetical protein